jgi:hypothetical protein
MVLTIGGGRRGSLSLLRQVSLGGGHRRLAHARAAAAVARQAGGAAALVSVELVQGVEATMLHGQMGKRVA